MNATASLPGKTFGPYTYPTIDSLNISPAGSSAFVRVDMNAPVKNGIVQDDTRIQAAIPTVRELQKMGPVSVVMASHLGRPKGDGYEKAFSMSPVADRLREEFGMFFLFEMSYMFERLDHYLDPGMVALLENLRFRSEEKKNDPEFAKELAMRVGNQIYVNDAFGTMHRAHASTVGMAEHVEQKAIGRLVEKELDALQKLLYETRHPFVFLLGGAKVSGKIQVIENLLGLADKILIGGAMAYTFLKAQGKEVGNSLVQDDYLEVAQNVLDRAAKEGKEVLLPDDFKVANAIDDTNFETVRQIPSDKMGLDIGPETIVKFQRAMAGSEMVGWNGPMGLFEEQAYAQGTNAMAEALAALGAFTFVGGGDSASALRKSGFVDQISHLSTGGGASLKALTGVELPALKAIRGG